MFKSIVVAYDGSPHSGRALEIGTDLAKQGKIPLGIIFVVERHHLYIPGEVRKMGEVEHLIDPTPKMMVNFENAPATMMSSMAQADTDSQAAMFQYADFVVDQAQRHARDEGVNEVESSVVMGYPAEKIVAFARDRKADLIITGSRGFGKLKSLVLGSTSHRVTELAKCSCLIVK